VWLIPRCNVNTVEALQFCGALPNATQSSALFVCYNDTEEGQIEVILLPAKPEKVWQRIYEG